MKKQVRLAMADETFQIAEQSLEVHISRLVERLEALRPDAVTVTHNPPIEPRVELRSLELWRAVISECLATFFYVVLVTGAAGAASGSQGGSPALVVLATAMAAGLSAATLTHCFRHISGSHMNPAITVGLAVTRQITPLRSALFVAAQCGGGIAGAALLYGVTMPGYQGNLQAAMPNVPAAWERFGLEFILTFILVLTHCVSSEKPSAGPNTNPSLPMGAVYAVCTLVSMPYLNPARALGPSFVLNRWDGHWIAWAGPVTGGIAAALLHALVFSSRRRFRDKDSADGDSSSVHSDEDAYDDLDKQHHHHQQHKYPSAYATYRPAPAPQPAHLSNPGGLAGYCPTLTTSLYPGGGASKLERVESLYGGTRSLYCKSPTLSRANLHRSQSVYSKPPRAPQGPLLPARDLYPTHQAIAHNQNAHNQMQIRESNYGTRPVNSTRDPSPATYATRQNPTGASQTNSDDTKATRRPESMYGMVVSQPRRNQSAQSDDSSYGSYRGTGTQVGTPGTTSVSDAYHHHIPPPVPLQY